MCGDEEGFVAINSLCERVILLADNTFWECRLAFNTRDYDRSCLNVAKVS